MITTILQGRLGNQFHQIAMMLAYCKKHNLEYYIPDVAYHCDGRKMYFPHLAMGIELQGLQEYHEQPVHAVANPDGTFNYNVPVYQDIPLMDNIKFVGYWQTFKYFDEYRDYILEKFQLSGNTLEGIVGIHVRRGDFLQLRDKHPELPLEYYKTSVKHFEDLGYKHFIIFSDDPKWCDLELVPTLHKHGIYIVTTPTDRGELDDMSLLSSCQPIGTMVKLPDNTEVPIETLKEGDRVMAYSNTHTREYLRLIGKGLGTNNGRKITSFSERMFVGNLVKVIAGSKINLYTPDHQCIVAMGNCFYKKFIVYLMRKDNKYRVGITTPTNYHQGRKIDVKGYVDVRKRLNEEKGDDVWILSMFNNREDALIEEEYISVKFGMPQIRFRELHTKSKNAEKFKNRIEIFWNRFGNNDSKDVTDCLSYYNRDVRFPFYSSKKSRKNTVIVTRENDIIVRACNILDGMKMLDADIYLSKSEGKGYCKEAWVDINVTYESYRGKVYSMDISGNHTYIGNGIVTHNCSHQILCYSTFGFCAAWLNRNPNKIVIVPPKRFIFGGANNDMIPNYFTQLEFEQ